MNQIHEDDWGLDDWGCHSGMYAPSIHDDPDLQHYFMLPDYPPKPSSENTSKATIDVDVHN